MNYKDLNIEEEYEAFKNKNIEEIYQNLKVKVESKKCTQKEYKEYQKVSNLKDNLFIIENLMNYINDLKKEILRLEKEKEDRQLYRELQKKHIYISRRIKLFDEGILNLKKLDKEDFDEEEKKVLEEHIESTIEQKAELKKELEEIQKQIQEKELLETKRIYSYEEQRIEIFKIKEKMYHVAIALDYLLKGNSWNETLKYYMERQKSKYKMKYKDIDAIKDDIKRIRHDTKIGNEIIEIAYNYDYNKKNDKNETEYLR